VDDGTAPPSAPAHLSTEIRRGVGPETEGCTGEASASSCDGVGRITLRVSPSTDDRTPAEQIGYRMIVVDGTPPEGAGLGDEPVLLLHDSYLFLGWSDDAEDEQESVDFTVVLIAVDAAGNESAPSDEIHIRHGGRDPGCAVDGGGRRTPTAAVIALASLGLLVARRRSSPRRIA